MKGVEIPAGLDWWRDVPGGAEWLERLPRLVAECAEQWGIRPGRPLAGGNVALVLEAGDDAVLKIHFPDPESEHEADALRAWNGNGAVRLLADDHERRALLIERCVPGTPLLELDDDGATDVVAGLLPSLWVDPPAGLRLLSDLAGQWVEELPATWERYGRPFDRVVLDGAVGALRELGPTQGTLVLANEDLHAGNVLRARREPWLVIDPKPIAAECEFTPVAMIRDRQGDVLSSPDSLGRLRRRLARFSELGLDRERVRSWTLAHTIAWGFEPHGFLAGHGEIARLLLEA